jgi:hypothetical protein
MILKTQKMLCRINKMLGLWLLVAAVGEPWSRSIVSKPVAGGCVFGPTRNVEIIEVADGCIRFATLLIDHRLLAPLR